MPLTTTPVSFPVVFAIVPFTIISGLEMAAPFAGDVMVTVIGLRVVKVLSTEEDVRLSLFVEVTLKWYSVCILSPVSVMLWVVVSVATLIVFPYAVVVPYSTTLVEAWSVLHVMVAESVEILPEVIALIVGGLSVANVLSVEDDERLWLFVDVTLK